jgi:hypothetical protein
MLKTFNIFNSIIAVILLLIFMPSLVKSQQYFSFGAGFGVGKIQYYENFHPVFLSGAEDEDLKYSPAWTFSAKSTWIISKNIDFSLALSHLTITSNTGAVLPDWFGFNEEKLTQGFIHIVPAISIKTPDERFRLNSGIKFGTASPFGAAKARSSSHSLGSLHADIGLTNEFQYRINKYFRLGIEWIEGLTYYNYFEGEIPGTDEKYYSFFKYRSFQLTVEYEINSK